MAADNQGLELGASLPGGSFSRLLLSDYDGDNCGNLFSSSSFFSVNTPTMLCFGDFSPQNEMGFTQTSPRITEKSGIEGSDFSSPPSRSNSKRKIIRSSSESKKKRNGPGQEPMEVSGGGGGVGAGVGGESNRKKNRKGNSTISNGGNAKGKREKLGERIMALQQIVSPYGKTDTASVLHEAMGYIRFLQDQVKVLCSPYLQSQLPYSDSSHSCLGGSEAGDWMKALKSRGLCLVPVDGITRVGNFNDADFWSPSMTGGTSEP